MDKKKTAEIEKWQNSIFDAFSHGDVLGGKYLGPVMDAEPIVGQAFVEKYYGHRVLTDAFLDFFGETLLQQFNTNEQNGWPEDRPHYVLCLMMFLTIFRSLRAAELVSVKGGYPLQAYIIQRSIKDQLFALCSAANGMDTFAKLFGWDGVADNPWSEETYSTVIKKRMQVEGKILRKLIGKESGLSEQSQEQLSQWNRMFNWEAHRGLLTLSKLTTKLVKGELPQDISPLSDEITESMYMNRSHELGWMCLRLLPYMRRAETLKDADWDNKWKLLDDSFQMMVDGLGGLGKKISPAIIELVHSKFALSAETYYSEPA